MIDLTTFYDRADAVTLARTADDLRKEAAQVRAAPRPEGDETPDRLADRLEQQADELETYLLRERGTALA